MKKYMILCAGLCLAMVFTGCKSKHLQEEDGEIDIAGCNAEFIRDSLSTGCESSFPSAMFDYNIKLFV